MVLRMGEWHYQCSVAFLHNRDYNFQRCSNKTYNNILFKYGLLKNRIVMKLPNTFIILNILVQ